MACPFPPMCANPDPPPRVVPVAEECGVYLAMHPDDPPIAVLKGYNRIMNTQEVALTRTLTLTLPQPYSQITPDRPPIPPQHT